MSQYIDAHTHKQSNHTHIYIPSSNEWVNFKPTSFDQFFTLGVHPWEAGKVDFNSFKKAFTKLSEHPQFLGLGEIGLDRSRKENFKQQINLFEKSLLIAKENPKLIIVLHCVRAFSDILQFLKKYQIQNPLLWHQFQGNAQILKQTSRFDSYYSFGHSFMKEVPLDKLLLETDEHSTPIETIYDQAARAYNIPMELFLSKVHSNFTRIRDKSA